MTTVRWGVLSTAKIARQKVIPATRAAEGCEVVAIAGRDPDRTAAVAAELTVPTAHGSYDDLLADPEVDIVYIPLPNHLHAEWTIRAAEAGKHVLCEKPLALDAAEAQRMVDACVASDVLLVEAFMYRHHPSWVAVRELVDSGRIGDLVAVQTWFSFFNDDPTNIRNIADYGGGALMDIGCYAVNASRMLLGSEPDRVSSSIVRDQASGVDVLTSATLDFGDRTATFTCSTRCEPDQRVHVYGTEGRISVEIPFNIPLDRPTRIMVTAGGTPPVAPDTETITFDTADQYRIQAELVAAAVRGDADAVVPPTDAVANMTVIDRILAAAE